MNLYRAYSMPPYTDEKLEIVTRCFVREEFGKSFRANEAVPDRQALERVLFDTIYPCPGGGA